MERAIVRIEKGFYYSAGRKYKWSSPRFLTEGVGIELSLLQNYEEIEIIVNDISYTVDCEVAIRFIRQFKSVEKHGEADLGIISKSLLRKVPEVQILGQEISPIPTELSPTAILQSKLF